MKNWKKYAQAFIKGALTVFGCILWFAAFVLPVMLTAATGQTKYLILLIPDIVVTGGILACIWEV